MFEVPGRADGTQLAECRLLVAQLVEDGCKLHSDQRRGGLLIEQAAEQDRRVASAVQPDETRCVPKPRLGPDIGIRIFLERLVDGRNGLRVTLGVRQFGEFEHRRRRQLEARGCRCR